MGHLTVQAASRLQAVLMTKGELLWEGRETLILMMASALKIDEASISPRSLNRML